MGEVAVDEWIVGVDPMFLQDRGRIVDRRRLSDNNG
jgi:hypothetical protein